MNKLLAALTALCLAAAAHAFDSRELTVQLQAPKTVQGRFTQQKYLRTLTKPVTTSGRFALRPGHGLFWHLQKPFELRLRVRRDGISRQDASGAWKSNGSQSTQAAQVKLFMAAAPLHPQTQRQRRQLAAAALTQNRGDEAGV